MLERTLRQSITLPYSSLEPYFCQTFTFSVLGYKFGYHEYPYQFWRALKLAQEHEVAGD